jgi:hypothetical protein
VWDRRYAGIHMDTGMVRRETQKYSRNTKEIHVNTREYIQLSGWNTSKYKVNT